jgi:hypothetical protein
MADLRLRFSSAKRRYGYGETVHVRAVAENTSGRVLYLVMGRVYPAEPVQGTMDVLHGQVECGPNASYFAFRPPELKRLGARRTSEFEFSISMPLHRYGVGPDGRYREWAVPVSGPVKLAVVLGYLSGPFRPKTDDPWGEFTRLQKLTTPTTVTLEIGVP